MVDFNVFALVSVVSPSVDNFIVKEGGLIDREGSIALLLSYIDELSDSEDNMVKFQDDVVNEVNKVLSTKKKGERVPVANLAAYLANRYVGNTIDSINQSPVVADWITCFIKRHSESSNTDHVPSGEVHWYLQEKGKGAGICLIEDKPQR